MASIILTRKLGVELLRQGLNEELDPEDLVEHYQQTLRKFVSEP
jgi:hypothetical protein